MPHRLMYATALALGLGAAAMQFWPQAPVERVATRAEMIAAHRDVAEPRIVPASVAACQSVPAPRTATDI